MKTLFDRNDMQEEQSGWKKKAFQSFHNKMTDKEHRFPCIPAYQGYLLNHVRFGFAADPRTSKGTEDMAKILLEYSRTSREYGDYSALILFFETPMDLKRSYSIHEYEHLFWKLLSRVSRLDPGQWPNKVAKDPSHFTWEYCFNGEQYFVYCATPAHTQRRSRYFPYFMLAITPRWVLQKFLSSKEHARKVKKLIRERLVSYDLVPPHPDLKWYGQKDNLEWKQYFLRDDDTSASKCPFHYERNNH